MQNQASSASGGVEVTRTSPCMDSVYLSGLAMALNYSLGNSLTALAAQIKSICVNLDSDVPDPARARVALGRIETILQVATDRANSVTDGLQGRKSFPVPCDLNRIVTEVAERFANQTFCSRLQVSLELAHDFPLLDANPAEIARIATELMMNAAEAMYADPRSDGLMTVRTIERAGSVCMEVSDSGGGTSDPERIFDMHHTTKRQRSGLGLSVARALAIANGGQLMARNNDEGGLTVLLMMPSPRSLGSRFTLASSQENCGA